MHWNRELDALTKRGYDAHVIGEIRRLEALLDEIPALAAALDDLAARYSGEGTLSMPAALERIDELSKEFGQNAYTLDLLFILNCLPNLHEAYRARGIPDNVFYESMDDIRCKINECLECKGVVGTFVADWYDGFFKLNRFAYGCFQYEPYLYDKAEFCFPSGRAVKAGDTLVNIHIPSRGIALTDETRFASYREAYRHFSERFPDGIVLFCCYSWLLYPRQTEFLPERMNVRKFMGDFTLVASGETEKFHDRWRVFGKNCDLPPDKLPRDTTLRLAYADWLKQGNKAGWGFGVFAFDGERILR